MDIRKKLKDRVMSKINDDMMAIRHILFNTQNIMLKKALCKTMSEHYTFSYEEIYKVYSELKSIDETIRVVQMAFLNDVPLENIKIN